MSLVFEMKTLCMRKGLISNVMTHKLCQNVNFVNWGTTIQIDIQHVLLDILPISLLSRAHGTSG